jgi:hypothetical protein
LLLPHFLVTLPTWPRRADTRADQLEELVLVQRLQVVLLDRRELGRTRIVAKDDVRRLGRRLAGDAPAVPFCELDGLVA